MFGTLYQSLYSFYKNTISDSYLKKATIKGLYILDSSTISLFKAILKPAGRKRKDGTSKGGMKVHSLLNADTNIEAYKIKRERHKKIVQQNTSYNTSTPALKTKMEMYPA